MADAYKGLTIQIGADTTSLTKALHAADTAARETQSQLRKMQNAMNFDGTDSRAVTQQLKIMSEQSSALAKKAALLKKELTQLDDAGIGKLASETKDATYQAEKAREAYAKVVSEIKAYKNAIAKAYDPNFNVNKPTTDPFRKLNESAEGLYATAKEVEAEMGRLGASTEEVAHYANNLVPAFERASDALKTANKVSAYGKVKTDLVETEAKARSLRAEFGRLSESHPAQALSAEFLKAGERAEYFGGKVSEAKGALNELEAAFNLNPGSIQTTTARFVAMANAITQSENQLKELRTQLASLESAGAAKTASEVKDVSKALLNAKTRVEALAKELDELRASDGVESEQAKVKRLSALLEGATNHMNELAAAEKYLGTQASIDKLNAELETLRARANQATTSFKNLRGMLQNLGWSMTATLGSAATIFASRAIDAAQEVDSAYRDMRKTVNGTEEQFEELYDAALKYSTTHVTDAASLLEIEALGGQLGVATNKLEAFATVVSNLDIATDLDAETAAEQLGQLSGILDDMTDDDFAKYGDALTRLGNNNSTLESKISDVMLRIASMGTIAGFTTPQLLAWSTAIAATGQGAESSGTAISKTMSNIESAVGAGGDKLKAFAQVANMSATEFANAWKTDPSSAMQQFIQGLADIEANGGSADSTLVSLGITSVRQKQALLGLMQTIGTLNDNLTMSQDAWDGVGDAWGDAGDAAREAERKAEGFSGAVTILQNSFEALGVEVGSTVQPFFEQLASSLGAITTWFQDAPPTVRNLTVAMVALFAVFGPGLIAMTAVLNAWETLKTSFAKSTVLKAAQANAQAAGVSFQAMAAGEKAAAVGAQVLSKAVKSAVVVAALGVVVSKVSEVSEAMKDAAEKTRQMQGALETVAASGAEVGDVFEQTLATAADKVSSAASSQYELFDSISGSLTELNTNSSLLDAYTSKIVELGSKAGLTASEQLDLKTAVDGYNDITGDSVKIIDSQTGALSKQVSEIQANSEAWKQNAEAQAYQEAYADALAQQIKNKNALELANEKLATSEKGVYEGAVNFWGYRTALLSDEQGRSYADLQANVEELTAADEENSKIVETLGGKLSSLKTRMQQTSSGTDEATTKATQFAAALGKTSDEFTTLVNDTTEAVESSSSLQALFSQTGLSAEEFAYALSACGTSVSDLSSDLDEMASKVQNVFDAIDQQAEVSVDEMLATLQGNIDATNSWASNLKELYARAGEGAGKALVDSIAEKGPEYASTVAALAEATDGEWDSLVAKWGEAGAAATNAAATAVGANTENLTNAVKSATEKTGEVLANANQNLVEGVDAGMGAIQSSVQNGMDGLIEGIDYTLGESAERASQSGSDVGSSYAAGVSSKTGEASEAASGITQATDEEIQQSKDTAWQIGAATGSNFAVGLWSKAGESGNAGSDVGSSAVNSLSQYSSTAYQWGAHMGSNFAAGLWSKTSEASSAASAVARAAADQLEHSIAKKGPLHNGGKGEKPWGAHLVQNFVAGIQSELPEFNRTMETVAKAAAGYMSNAGGSATLASGGASVKLAGPQVVVNVEAPKNGSAALTDWLENNLGTVIADNAPNLIIDNDAGRMVVDTRLSQLQRKAAMNRG